MTKQEKIKEGLRAELNKHLYLPVNASVDSKLEKDRAIDEFLDGCLSCLHNNDVVIKVDRDKFTLPFVTDDFTLSAHGVYIKVSKEALSEQGYVATVPLIKECYDSMVEVRELDLV